MDIQPDRTQFTLRKVQSIFGSQEGLPPDSLIYWMTTYCSLAIQDVRSKNVAKKIELHLNRFRTFYELRYGHDKVSTCLQRDVSAWQKDLVTQEMAPSTVNNHLASLSSFTTWLMSHDRRFLPSGDPAKGVSELGLPPLEPRALSDAQVNSLKSLCDRLKHFHVLKGRSWTKEEQRPLKAKARPLRDRAIVYVLLSTGLRREEIVGLNLEQLEPNDIESLRMAKRARIHRVKGKGKTERFVHLSNDARLAIADYLETERIRDIHEFTGALFLSAREVSARRDDGRLSEQSINNIVLQIGKWHDSEIKQKERHVTPLTPHDLRHTFAFKLAAETGNDRYELQRRLGHRSERYIQVYTNPPEEIAAGYVEKF